MSDTPETDQIERDLAKTRERLDSRLDQLQDRLSPGQLVNDAFAYFKGGDGADFTQEVVTKLKANPLPALLTGVGIAWMMASSNRSAPVPTRVRRELDIETRLRAAEAGVIRGQDEHPDLHASRVDEARGKVLGITASHASSGRRAPPASRRRSAPRAVRMRISAAIGSFAPMRPLRRSGTATGSPTSPTPPYSTRRSAP